MPRLYGTQCARCGTLMLTDDRSRPLCASCAADEQAVKELGQARNADTTTVGRERAD